MKVSEIVDFLRFSGRLKRLKRTGWLLKGIPEPESIADHTFRTVVISYLLAKHIGNVDLEKVMRIALFHDLAEGVTGDIPIEAKKFVNIDEISAMKSIPGIQEVVLEDFEEFQMRSSDEARIVRAADKIDLLLQVLEYEESTGILLDDFWKNEDNRVDFDFHPIILDIIKEIERRRKNV